jgi:hypothetical protein
MQQCSDTSTIIAAVVAPLSMCNKNCNTYKTLGQTKTLAKHKLHLHGELSNDASLDVSGLPVPRSLVKEAPLGLCQHECTDHAEPIRCQISSQCTYSMVSETIRNI